MYVAKVPNRNSPPAFLLRESYRVGSQVKSRTIANITHWPQARIDALKAALKVGSKSSPLAFLGPLEDQFVISRSLPHGHVVAALGSLRRLRLHRILSSKPSRHRDLCIAMILQRILDPSSKLALSRGLDPQTLDSTLGETLGLDNASADDLYAAMDWLVQRQPRVEAALAKRHLSSGSLVLYDLTSVYMEGRHCPLARLGYSRDGHRGKPQIEFGLITNADGCPVAAEVFDGNVGDPSTVGVQVKKLQERFGLKHIVLVGDRGMITQARIAEDLKPNQLDWITALRAPAIKTLVRNGALQPSLFDQTDLAEISSPDYPGERLIVCMNPLLAEERARKREDLLQATQQKLDEIVQATQRSPRPFHGEQRITRRVAKAINHYKMEKHFRIEITETSFRYERSQESIATEAATDGIYVIRTSVSKDRLSPESAVESYKGLAVVERAFRCLKTVDLKVRPIHHRLEDRVRSHVFLCMLAYYVEWHMRQALAPILFDDHDRQAGQTERTSVVAPARRSPKAQRKAATKQTADGDPVHSFRSLLKDLATLSKHRIQPTSKEGDGFEKLTRPTALQQRAFDLLEVPLSV